MEYPKDRGLRQAFNASPKFRPETYYSESDALLRVRYVIDYGIFDDFLKARKPAATWSTVQPLQVSEEQVDELVQMFPDQPFFFIETEEDDHDQKTGNRGDPQSND